MDPKLSSASDSRPRMPGKRDAMVVAAMGLVAVAISFALNLHFALPGARAGIAGVMIFALMVGAHFLFVPRMPEYPSAEDREDEDLWRALTQERNDVPMTQRARLPIHSEPDDMLSDTSAQRRVLRRPRILGRGSKSKAASPGAADFETHKPALQGHQRDQSATRPPPITGSRPNEDAGLRSEEGAKAAAPKPGVTEQDSKAGDGAYWSYRPSDHAMSVSTDASETTAMPEPPQLTGQPGSAVKPTSQPQPRPPSERDVEMVQSMIKKLAHQVNATDLLSRASRASEATPPPPPPRAGPPELPDKGVVAHSNTGVQPPALPPSPAPRSTTVSADDIESSLGALRMTASAMRQAADASPAGAPDISQPLNRPLRGEGTELANAITGAIAADRAGVFLEAILNLNGLQPQHFEVSTRLEAPEGLEIDTPQFERQFDGANVLPLVDRHRFMKAASVCNRLLERGKTGALLTRLYRQSLSDRDYCYTLATHGVSSEVLAKQMVLVLTQDSVRALSAIEWQTVSELRELGYRFAMCDVTDLDMDFARLAAAGCEFVKLPARIFDEPAGSHASGGAPHGLCAHLMAQGLAPIIEGLDDSAAAAEAVAHGAELGQGAISGGPRLMKAELVSSGGIAAA